MKVPIFTNSGAVEFRSYFEQLPFPFYVLVRHLEHLPRVLADALTQWISVLQAGSGLE